MDNIHRNFGLVIAFVIPGLVALWGISTFSLSLTAWLATTPDQSPTIGSFLYLTIGSLAIGLIVSAIRWAIVDSIHHRSGVDFPEFDFSHLHEKLESFVLSVEWYYRYYQFYANMLVAIACAAVCRACGEIGPSISGWIGIAALEAILFAASRDSLSRYYKRVAQLLGTQPVSQPSSASDCEPAFD